MNNLKDKMWEFLFPRKNLKEEMWWESIKIGLDKMWELLFPRKNLKDETWESIKIGLGASALGVFYGIRYYIRRVFSNCYLFTDKFYEEKIYVATKWGGCLLAGMRLVNRRPIAYSIVGMDCELKSTSVNGGQRVPATLQLANPDGLCCVFELSNMEKERQLNDQDSKELIEWVLADSNVLKVGVGVIEDANDLRRGYGLICRGCLDIRHVAAAAGEEPKGLNDLAESVLGKKKIVIPKSKRGPWEVKFLNEYQLHYAATDARLGLEIFMKLNEKVIERNYSWWRRIFWDEHTFWQHTLKQWQEFIDRPFIFAKAVVYIDEGRWISYIPRWPLQYMNLILHSTASGRCCIVCGFEDDGIHDAVKLKSIVPIDYHVNFDDAELYYINLCKRCLAHCQYKVDYPLRHELAEECGAPYPLYGGDKLARAKEIAFKLNEDIIKDFNVFAQKLCKFLPYSTLDSAKTIAKTPNRILERELQALIPKLSKGDLHRRTMEIILTMDCWSNTPHGGIVQHYYEKFYRPHGLEFLRWRWCHKFMEEMKPQHLSEKWKTFYQKETSRFWTYHNYFQMENWEPSEESLRNLKIIMLEDEMSKLMTELNKLPKAQ